MRRTRGYLLFLTIAPLAWAAKKEINLAHDGATDPAATALIVTEYETGAKSESLMTWLHGITDLSLPTDKQHQVVLSSLTSPRRGHYARVSPGSYLVDVECQLRAGAGRSNSEELTIEAVAGHVYVIGCVANAKESKGPKAYIRETELEKLQLKK